MKIPTRQRIWPRVALHKLQDISTTNINSDGNGMPKRMIIGGVQRTSPSSQNFKRMLKEYIYEHADFPEPIVQAVRTRKLAAMMTAQLQEIGATPEEIDAVLPRVHELATDSQAKNKEKAKKKSSKNGGPDLQGTEEVATKFNLTTKLLLLSENEFREVATRLLDAYRAEPEKFAAKPLQNHFKYAKLRSAATFAPLFGRTNLAESFENYYSAIRVARPFSTHRHIMQMDLVSSSDDLSAPGEDDGYMDVEYYTSATLFYTVFFDLQQLWENVKEDTPKMLWMFIEGVKAFVCAPPIAMQNNAYSHALPRFVLAEVWHKGVPWTYHTAFIPPVRPSLRTSPMDASIKALAKELCIIERTSPSQVVYPQPLRAIVNLSNVASTEFPPSCQAGIQDGFDELLEWLRAAVQPIDEKVLP